MNETLLNDIYKSRFCDGFKQNLKEKIPEIIQVSDKNFGREITNVIFISVNKIMDTVNVKK